MRSFTPKCCREHTGDEDRSLELCEEVQGSMEVRSDLATRGGESDGDGTVFLVDLSGFRFSHGGLGLQRA